MTTTTVHAAGATTTSPDAVRTARTTGLLYLALAITGAVGFQLIRGLLFVPDSPDGTLANLTSQEPLARVGVVVEMGIVLSQALVALWFFRLFRRVDSVAAASIATFGTVNAVAILGSAALLATALDLALDASLVPGGAAAAVQSLYLVSGHLWTIGGIFFGLWLIPMGRLVLRSGWMPGALGWILVVGGVGYVLSAFAAYLVPGAGAWVDVLALPATVGELWMIGYLLVRGVRRSRAS